MNWISTLKHQIIFIPDSINIEEETFKSFFHYLQEMANRIAVGHLRYGPPNRRKKYVDRLVKELETYKRTGNKEQLLNIANYTFLETMAPQNGKFHFDPFTKSATRTGK